MSTTRSGPSGTPRPPPSTTSPTTGCATPARARRGGSCCWSTCPRPPPGSPTWAAAPARCRCCWPGGVRRRPRRPSPEMVARARAKADGHRVTVAVADAAAPACPPAPSTWCCPARALGDAAAAGLRRWVDLLAPGGRLLLVEGRGTPAAGWRPPTSRAVASIGRSPAIRHLTEPVSGAPIDDERYLLVSDLRLGDVPSSSGPAPPFLLSEKCTCPGAAASASTSGACGTTTLVAVGLEGVVRRVHPVAPADVHDAHFAGHACRSPSASGANSAPRMATASTRSAGSFADSTQSKARPSASPETPPLLGARSRPSHRRRAVTHLATGTSPGLPDERSARCGG